MEMLRSDYVEFDMKTAEQFYNCLKITAARQEKSQLSPQHGENMFYSTLRHLQREKKMGKKSSLQRKKPLHYGLEWDRRKQWHVPSSPYFVTPLFHAAQVLS